MAGGELKYINPDELVVGDLVKLKAGDGIPADGVLLLQSHKQQLQQPQGMVSIEVRKEEEWLRG